MDFYATLYGTPGQTLIDGLTGQYLGTVDADGKITVGEIAENATAPLFERLSGQLRKVYRVGIRVYDSYSGDMRLEFTVYYRRSDEEEEHSYSWCSNEDAGDEDNPSEIYLPEGEWVFYNDDIDEVTVLVDGNIDLELEERMPEEEDDEDDDGDGEEDGGDDDDGDYDGCAEDEGGER